MKLKPVALLAILASQIAFVWFVIVPEFRLAARIASIQPGQCWAVKCRTPFESYTETVKVIAVANGWVRCEDSLSQITDRKVRDFALIYRRKP